MTHREPPDVAILAARIMRAYPSLSAYSAASLAAELCAIERAQRRHAERCCNADYRKPGKPITGYGRNATACAVHDPAAEERVGARIARQRSRWYARAEEWGATVNGRTSIELRDDPRGRVLLAHFPGEAEASGV